MIEVIGIAELILNPNVTEDMLFRNSKGLRMEVLEKLPGDNYFKVKYLIHIPENPEITYLDDYRSIVKPHLENRVPAIFPLIQHYSIKKIEVKINHISNL